jgi:hypothetical protein
MIKANFTNKNYQKMNVICIMMIFVYFIHLTSTLEENSQENESNIGVFINDSDGSTEEEEQMDSIASANEEQIPIPTDQPEDPMFKKKSGKWVIKTN